MRITPPGLHIHEKFGFEHVGVLKQVGYKFERWLDVIYMQLLLQAGPAQPDVK